MTIEKVQQQIEQLEAATDLNAANKDKSKQLLQDAVKQLQQADKFIKEKASLIKIRENSAKLEKQLEAKLAENVPQVKLTLSNDATVDTLEQKFAEAKNNLIAEEKALAEIIAETTRRTTRLTEIPQRQHTLTQELKAIEKALAAPPQLSDPAPLTAAQQTYQLARLKSVRAELAMMKEELLTYEAASHVYEIEQQLAERSLKQANEYYRAWELELNKRRIFKAREQLRDAEELVINASEVLKPLAKEYLRLAQLRVGQPNSLSIGMISKIEQAQTEWEQVKQSLKEVDAIALEFDEKEELISSANFLGPWLMEQRIKLPHVATMKRQISKRQQDINSLRVQISELNRKRKELQNRSDTFGSWSSKLNDNLRASQRKNIIDAAEELYEIQLEIVRDLLDDYKTYKARLESISASQQELITKTDQLASEINKHLVWTRTTGTLSIKESNAARNAIFWLIEPSNWTMLLFDFQQALTDQFLIILTLVGGAFLLFVMRHTAKRKLRSLGKAAGGSYLAPFHNTVIAIFLTILVSLFWPLLFYTLGWLLNSSLSATPFSRAVGGSLMASSSVLLMLEIMRKMLSTEGLAGPHFRWQVFQIRDIRRAIRFITILGLPLFFVIILIQYDADLDRINSLGRLLQIILLLVLAFFLHRILNPSESRQAEAAIRTHSLQAKLGYWFCMSVLLAIMLLTFLGYQFTAWELFKRLLMTLALMVFVSLLHGAMSRWLRLLRGMMTLEQVQAKKVAKEEVTEDDLRDLAEMESGKEPQIDLESVNQQTRKLLRTAIIMITIVGFWYIWSDVVPGAAYFDYVLWRASEIQVVTVRNVLLAIFIGIIAIVCARNLPGLIDVLLPHNINMDAGSRYAFSTLVRYVVLGLAVAVVSSLIGFGWSKVQWLVAALSVGVGFGLQELVANFISGLILLFERPIRVGDVITVDGVTGVVTRVQMRATTIRNWDRQEYIVPNKDLVTGRLLNWTLSSQVNRIVITVGVAYGSDVQKVRDVLLSIVNKHDKVLEDPQPLVTFEQFADSSLNFVIRACIDRLSDGSK